jgi:hypothetical protein
MLVLTAVLALLATALHSQAFALLVSASFRQVSWLLPLAVLSGGLFNVGQLLCLVPLAAGDSSALLPPKVGTAVLAVLLYAWGAVAGGVAGVVLGGLVFALLFAIWTVNVAVRTTRRVHRVGRP